MSGPRFKEETEALDLYVLARLEAILAALDAPLEIANADRTFGSEERLGKILNDRFSLRRVIALIKARTQ